MVFILVWFFGRSAGINNYDTLMNQIIYPSRIQTDVKEALAVTSHRVPLEVQAQRMVTIGEK